MTYDTDYAPGLGHVTDMGTKTIDLTELKPRFRGELITAADGARYDSARAVFNGMYDQRPAVLARAALFQAPLSRRLMIHFLARFPFQLVRLLDPQRRPERTDPAILATWALRRHCKVCVKCNLTGQ